MTMFKVVTFEIETSAGGAYTGTANASAGGPYLLHSVEWVDGTLDDNNTAVLSVTNTISGVDRTLLTLGAGEGDNDTWYFPQVLVCDNGGTATTFYTHQVVAGQLKLVVAAGGNVKTGKCLVYLLDA